MERIWRATEKRAVPVYISLKTADGCVESLVAQYEGVLLDLPDVPVLVPGLQVGLQVADVGGHPRHHGGLDLLQLLVLC